MSQTLREQFEREESLCWENDQGEPETEYVVWLEAKVEKFTSTNKQSTPYQTTCSHYRRIYGDKFCSECGMRY